MSDHVLSLVPLAGSYLPPPADFAATAVPPGDLIIKVSIWLHGPELPDPEAWIAEPRDKRAKLTRETFASTYGVADADIKTVLEYVEPFGIVPSDDRKERPDPRASRLLALRGPVAGFESAFGVKLALYGSDRESWIGRDGEVRIPRHLQGIVLGIFGLDRRPIGTRGGAAPRTAAAGLPTPPEVADHYGFPTVSAKGQCIALMQFGGGYRDSDIDDYFDTLPVRRPTVIPVIVPDGANNPDDDTYAPEVILDIDIAGSVAEDAKIVVYFAPHTEDGWVEALEMVVADTVHKPGTISISWGAAELGTSNTLTWTAAGMAKMRETFAKAALLEITVLAACGDHGSDCRVGDRRAHVPYPAADQRVIACGGTTITDITQATETAWSRGGGGISEVCSLPGYQNAVGVPGSINTGQIGRGVPDIAGYASPGFRFLRNGNWFPAAGTSLTAPLYAALMARLSALAGQPTGFILPFIYFRRAEWCRDIDDPASNGTSNSFNYAPGYYGRKGWDARTGLGVLQPAEIVANLKK